MTEHIKKALVLFLLVQVLPSYGSPVTNDSIVPDLQDTLVVHFFEYTTIYESSHGFMRLVHVQHDTIYYMGEPYVITFPADFKYTDTAFTECYFTGWANNVLGKSTGILVGDYKSARPVLYIDRNHNLDFSDDGAPTFISADSGSLIYLRNEQYENGLFPVKIKRMKLSESWLEKNEQMLTRMGVLAKNNRSVPVNFWFADQRNNFRVTRTMIDGEPVFIGLKDSDCNGLYNDKDHDRILIGDYEVNTISDRAQDGAVVYKDSTLINLNGKSYRVIDIDVTGNYLKLIPSGEKPESILAVGDPLPSILITLTNDSTVDLAGIQETGKYLLIDVWGMWCKPCLINLPRLEEIYAGHKDILQVVGLDFGDDPGKLASYLEQNPPLWPLNGYASEEFINTFNVEGFPDYILIDRDGNIASLDISITELTELLSDK